MWHSSFQAAWIQAISIQEPSEQYHAATACLLSNRPLVPSQLQAEPGLQAEVHLEAGKACHKHTHTTPDHVIQRITDLSTSADIPFQALTDSHTLFQAVIATAL